VRRFDPPGLRRLLDVKVEPGPVGGKPSQFLAEDHPVGILRRVDVDDVAVGATAVDAADHAHDRGDSAAGGDEEKSRRDPVGQGEGSFDSAEPDDVAGFGGSGEPG